MKTLKKTALKSSILIAVWIIFSAAPTAQNGPELQIHFENLAVDISLYFLSRDHTKDG